MDNFDFIKDICVVSSEEFAPRSLEDVDYVPDLSEQLDVGEIPIFAYSTDVGVPSPEEQHAPTMVKPKRQADQGKFDSISPLYEQAISNLRINAYNDNEALAEAKRAAREHKAAKQSKHKPVFVDTDENGVWHVKKAVECSFSTVGKKGDTRAHSKNKKVRDYTLDRKAKRQHSVKKVALSVKASKKMYGEKNKAKLGFSISTFTAEYFEEQQRGEPYPTFKESNSVVNEIVYFEQITKGLELTGECILTKEELFEPAMVPATDFMCPGDWEELCPTTEVELSGEPIYLSGAIDKLSSSEEVEKEHLLVVAVNESCCMVRRPLDFPRAQADRFILNVLGTTPIFHDVVTRYQMKANPAADLRLSPQSLVVSAPISGKIFLPYIGRNFFLRHVPRVVGGEHYCSHCVSFVYFCPHLAIELITGPATTRNYAAVFEIVFENMWFREQFAGEKPDFDLRNAYTRFCLVTVLEKFHPSPQLESWRFAEHKECLREYGLIFRPQSDGLGEKFWEKLKSIQGKLAYFFDQIPNPRLGDLFKTAFDAVKALTLALKDKIGFTVQSLCAFVTSQWINTFKAKLDALLVSAAEGFKSSWVYIATLLKIFVRYAAGYTVNQLFLELLLDPVFHGALNLIPKLFIAQEAGSDSFSYLFSVMCLVLAQILGYYVPSIQVVTKTFDQICRSVASYDRAAVWNKLYSLVRLYEGDDTPAYLESLKGTRAYPAVQFYEAFVAIQARLLAEKRDITSAEKQLLCAYRVGFQKIRPLLSLPEFHRVESLMRPAVTFVDSLPRVVFPKYRRCPEVFLFHGAPGIGKSEYVQLITEKIHAHVYKNSDTAMSTYHINPGDAYYSGYNEQDVFVFDEFLQGKDGDTDATQCHSIQTLFVLCTTSPQQLNMAAIEDKGKFVKCSIVLGCTNLPAGRKGGIENACTSVNCPQAVGGRITYRIEPIVQKPYCVYNRAIMLATTDPVTGKIDYVKATDVPPSELYLFKITDTRSEVIESPRKKSLWTHEELLMKIFDSYKRVKDYQPEEAEDEIEQLLQAREGFTTTANIDGLLVPSVAALKAQEASIKEASEAAKRLSKAIGKEHELQPYTVTEACYEGPEAQGAFDLVKKVAWYLNPYKAGRGDTYAYSVGEKPNFDLTCYKSVKDIRLTPEKGYVAGFIYDEADLAELSRRDVFVEFDNVDMTGWQVAYVEEGKVVDELAVIDSSEFADHLEMTYRGKPGKLVMARPAFIKEAASGSIMAITMSVLAVVGVSFAARYYLSKPCVVPGTDEEPVEVSQLFEDATVEVVPGFEAQAKQKTVQGYWPQSNPWTALNNPRAEGMAETVAKQVVAVLKKDGSKYCGGYFITPTKMLLPWHAASRFQDQEAECCFVYTGSQKVVVQRTVQSARYKVERVDYDLGVLVFQDPVPGMQNFSRTLAKATMNPCDYVRVSRDCEGNLEFATVVGYHAREGVHYPGPDGEIAIPASRLVIGDGTTEGGTSGSVYLRRVKLEMGDSFGGLVCGMHVAGQVCQGKWMMQTVLQAHVEHLYDSSATIVVGQQNTRAGKLGFLSEVTDKTPLIHKAKLGKTPIPYEGKYNVALLFPTTINGKKVDPVQNYLNKLRDHSVPKRLPDGIDKVVDKFIADELKQVNRIPHLHTDLASEFDRKYRNYEAVVGGSDVSGSIDGSAAVGHPLNLVGSVKRDFFLHRADAEAFGVPLNAPNESLLQEARVREADILSKSAVEVNTTCQFKEETRAHKRIVEGNTRVYYPVSVVDNMLQKKYFARTLAYLAEGWEASSGQFDLDKHLQTQVLKMQESLVEPGWITKVLVTDFPNFDLSIHRGMAEIISLTMRSIEAGRPILWEDRDNHLDEADAIRAGLLHQAFNCCAIVEGDKLKVHLNPSGGFLTTAINGVGNKFIVFYGVIAMAVDGRAKVQLKGLYQGDDGHTLIKSNKPLDIAVFTEAVKQLGFEPTSSAKDGLPYLADLHNPITTELSEYSFCSRRLSRKSVVLDFDRLYRILPFQEVGREREIIPQTLAALRDFVRAYLENGLEHYLTPIKEQVEYCGIPWERFPNMDNVALHECFTKCFDADPTRFKAVIPKYNQKRGQEITGNDIGKFAEGWVPQSAGHADTTFSEEVALEENSSGLRRFDTHMHKINLVKDDRLNRPFQVDSFMTGTTFATRTYNSMSSFFLGNFYAQMAIFNVAFIRCKSCIRFATSSSPVVTGRLLCGYAPYRNIPATVQEAYGYPTVELDLSTASHAELKFGTCAPQNWSMINDITSFSSYNKLFDFGRFFILPMTAITSSVRVTVFMWLEDVETRGPTVGSFTVAQGNNDLLPITRTAEPATKAAPTQLNNMDSVWLREHTPGWLAVGEASVASIARTVERCGYAITGPLSKLGSLLPLLAGFCNPPFNTDLTATVPLGMNTSQVLSQAATVVLGASQLTKVIPPPDVFNSPIDEMNISNIVTRWQYLTQVSWTGTTPIGAFLHWQVRPDYFETSSLIAPYTAYPTHLCYLSTMFGLWRGGLRFKLSLPKSNYQTGLLEIVYQSGTASISATTSKAATALPRIVWDVTESNTLEFDVPFAAATAWIPTYPVPFSSGGVFTKPEQTCGGINVNILNQLVDGSGLVPGPVAVLIYIAAMPDFEFAMPRLNPNVTYPIWSNQVGSFNHAEEYISGGEWEAQTNGGLFTEAEKELRAPLVLANDSDVYDHLTTTGERWLNLRVLIRRLSYPSSSIPFSGVLSFADVVSNNPWVKAIGRLYGFYCGSWRFSFAVSLSTDAYVAIQSTLQSVVSNNVPTHVIPSPLTGNSLTTPTDVTVPYQHLCTFLPVLRYANEFPDVNFITLKRLGAATCYGMYACGDDFTFGWLCGAPTITIATTVDYGTKAFF